MEAKGRSTVRTNNNTCNDSFRCLLLPLVGLVMEEDNVPPPEDEQIITMPSLSGVIMIAAVVNFQGRADYGLGNAKRL